MHSQDLQGKVRETSQMTTARASTHRVVVPKRREHLVYENDECETGVETAVRGRNPYQAAGDHDCLCDEVLHA